MKAVYSYWEDNKKKENGGFRTKRELAMMLALSLEVTKKQFSKTELVTNTYGKELLIDKYKLPFDSVRVELDFLNDTLDPDHWAYVKIYAYSIQTEPFIHIDNDVIIWDKIPEHVLQSDLFFQNKEYLEKHTGYKRLLNEAKQFPKINFEVLGANPIFAYNCGVVGVNNLEIIKEWKEIVDQYLFHPKNKETWTTIGDKHSQNHLFEQFFISALIKSKGMESKVKTVLRDNFYHSAITDFKFTHLWGEAKRKQDAMMKIRNRLFRDYPWYKKIFDVPETHAEIFDDIYRNELWGKGQGSGGGSSASVTFEYRRFLQNFLNEKSIKSVVDFGSGDWQFSRLVDWTGINYLGVDCVKTVVDLCNEKYSEIDPSTNTHVTFEWWDKVPDQEADLLIVKDVLIHWTNIEILQFFETFKKSKYKYCLITNHTKDDFLNRDIKTGEFHNIDINKAPFNVGAQIVLQWPNDPKTTYLLENK